MREPKILCSLYEVEGLIVLLSEKSFNLLKLFLYFFLFHSKSFQQKSRIDLTRFNVSNRVSITALNKKTVSFRVINSITNGSKNILWIRILFHGFFTFFPHKIPISFLQYHNIVPLSNLSNENCVHHIIYLKHLLS